MGASAKEIRLLQKTGPMSDADKKDKAAVEMRVMQEYQSRLADAESTGNISRAEQLQQFQKNTIQQGTKEQQEMWSKIADATLEKGSAPTAAGQKIAAEGAKPTNAAESLLSDASLLWNTIAKNSIAQLALATGQLLMLT
jgi:hypothetical protein